MLKTSCSKQGSTREKESLFLQQPQLLIGILYRLAAIDYTKEEMDFALRAYNNTTPQKLTQGNCLINQ